MTFDVEFNADHALLWSVRYALSKWPDSESNPYAYTAAGSACVLSCAAALEAVVNQIIQEQDKVRHWDELRLVSKIDTIADIAGKKIDWGRQPWQDISLLVRVRNWLAHHKDSYIGLAGAEGQWVVDSSNKAPRIDPTEVLQDASVRRFYEAVREAGLYLAELAGCEDRYAHLENEDYVPLWA